MKTENEKPETAVAAPESSKTLSIESITEGYSSDKSIVPIVKFVENIDAFATSFDPPASAELMIGAFSDLFGKLKATEATLGQRAKLIKSKIPEIDKSLKLVEFLKSQASSSSSSSSSSPSSSSNNQKIITRYNLCDMIHAKAEIDPASNIVNLWLGANVMLEYTYDEAIDLLSNKQQKAKDDLKDTLDDLATVRDQIITSEVNISRIYNWDVRRKRMERLEDEAAQKESS